MTPIEMERILQSMVVIVDTREQETDKLKERLEAFKGGYERRKLDYGDYSCKYTDLQGNERTLEKSVVIERKMGLDELCTCFTKDRARFQAEFERSSKDGAKTYLFIENANWEKLLNGKYRSKLNSKSLFASLTAWSIRYNILVVFCKSETTGLLIYELLYRELKETIQKEMEN